MKVATLTQALARDSLLHVLLLPGTTMNPSSTDLQVQAMTLVTPEFTRNLRTDGFIKIENAVPTPLVRNRRRRSRHLQATATNDICTKTPVRRTVIRRKGRTDITGLEGEGLATGPIKSMA